MLLELAVRHFVVIDEARVRFAPGMTALTGETGAGKSMLVDALAFVFGARATTDLVRAGANQAEVEVLVQADPARVGALLEEAGVDWETDEPLLLKRRLERDGRSRAWVQGAPAPVRLLRALGERLVELHGQHAQQALMRAEAARHVLDAEVAPALREEVARAYRAWREAEEALAALRRAREEAKREEHWLREELARLERLQPEPGLLARLRETVEAGRHRAQILEAAGAALGALEEGEPNAAGLIGEALRMLARASKWHERLGEAEALLSQAQETLGEAAGLLREVLEADWNPAELEEAETRLEELRAMLARHGTDEEGLLALAEKWRRKLELIEAGDWDEARARKALAEAEENYRAAAEQLSEARKRAAEGILARLRPELDALGMEGMALRFAVEPSSDPRDWREHGWDHVALLARTDAAGNWRPFAEVASGGELSRLALALRASGGVDAPPIAVFDEADVGVGGETAWRVGALLKRMSREGRQVLVISHLPQVAACADHQITVEKTMQEGRPHVRARVLEHEEARIAELARMLGDRAATQQAARMLAKGRDIQP